MIAASLLLSFLHPAPDAIIPIASVVRRIERNQGDPTQGDQLVQEGVLADHPVDAILRSFDNGQ